MESSNSLRREVGLFPAICTAVGIVVSSSALFMLGSGFASGGPAFVVAMVIAAFTNLCVAFSFSELAGMLPAAGGINHYTLPALGPTMGIFSVLSGYFMVAGISNAAESLVCGEVLSIHLFPNAGLSSTFWAFFMVIALGALNLGSVKSYATAQTIFASVMIGSMVVLSIIGLTGATSAEPVAEFPKFDLSAGGGVIVMLATAFWLFVGLEFVCPLAEEITNPNKFIPLAMISGIAIIFVSDILFGFMALKYIPMDVLAESTTPHVDAAMVVLGRGGEIWISIISLVATCSTLNTFVAAIPRMLFGMANEGEFPKVFGKLNKFGSPWAGVVLVTIITMLLIGFFDASYLEILLLAGCVGWMIAYIIAHIDVIVLRKKYPDEARPFKVPGGAILPIISTILLVLMIVMIVEDPEEKKMIYEIAGVGLVICAVFSVCWVKFAMKLPLWKPIPLEELKAQVAAEAEAIEE